MAANFEQMYSDFFGEKISDAKQIDKILCTGVELREFVEYCVMQNERLNSLKKPILNKPGAGDLDREWDRGIAGHLEDYLKD